LSQLLLCDKTFGHIRQYYASFLFSCGCDAFCSELCFQSKDAKALFSVCKDSHLMPIAHIGFSD